MKHIKQTSFFVFTIVSISIATSAFLTDHSALAASSCSGQETAVLSCGDDTNGIWSMILLIANILAAGVGIVAVGGLVYAAILYSSAEDNANQVSQAKSVITNVVIGIIGFGLMFSILQFIIPGGLNTPANPPKVAKEKGDKASDDEKNDKSEKNVEPDESIKTVRVTHLHSSGRFDRSTSTWKRELREFNEQYTPDVITLTETLNRSSVVDWNNWSHTNGESIVAWKTTVWKKVNTRLIELAPRTSSLRPSVISVAVLEHRQTKTRWLFTSSHIPASVDAGNGNFRPDESSQVNKWKAIMKHMPIIINDYTKRYDIKRRHTVITADWNINLSDSDWRDLMKGYLPDYVPSNPTGSAGTHGNRTIDTSFVSNNMTVTRWRSLGTISSSDHKPFLAKYRADK